MEERTCVIAAAAAESQRVWAEAADRLGYAVVSSARTGQSAFCDVERLRPDALFADAVLPLWDGLELAEKLCRAHLYVRPAVILRAPDHLLMMVRARAEAAGAEAVPNSLPIRELEGALTRLSPGARPLPPRLSQALEDTLDNLSVPEHPGRRALSRAATLVFFDERLLRAKTGALYPAAGEAAGVSGVQAERAMRHVIDIAWKRGAIERQYALFKGTIDAQRGKPTTGEMIARLAEVLRQEAVRQ